MITDSTKDAVTLLTKDHRNIESLFKRCLATDNPPERSELATQICKELTVHTQIEEEIFYPACRAKGVDEEDVNQAQVEHDAAKVLIAELLSVENDPFQHAKIQVLSDEMAQHIGEEERPGDGLFARARKAGLDMLELGQKIQQRKAQINAVLQESGVLLAPNPQSLHLLANGFCPEPHDKNRDESGRFVPGHGPIVHHHTHHSSHHH